MDASTWFTISIVGFSLAGVLLIVAIIMFYKMNIIAIIGDLSGRTASRQIQEIREHNTNSGKKRYKPSAFNIERGSVTEPVGAIPTRSSRLAGRGSTASQTVVPISQVRGNTGETVAPLPKAQAADATEVLGVECGTEILCENDATVILNDAQSTEVLGDDLATELLNDDFGTTVLYPTGELKEEEHEANPAIEFKIVKDIKITHTNETI